MSGREIHKDIRRSETYAAMSKTNVSEALDRLVKVKIVEEFTGNSGIPTYSLREPRQSSPENKPAPKHKKGRSPAQAYKDAIDEEASNRALRLSP